MNSNGAFAPSHKLEHLTCFLPGLLALGAATLPDIPPRHMWAARAFAHTCWTLYADSPSGLAPDEEIKAVYFSAAGEIQPFPVDHTIGVSSLKMAS